LDDEDDETQEVVLPFVFHWLAEHSVTVVGVSTNGNINVDKDNKPDNDDLCCDPVRIARGSA
jgi:hypothetical protein